ncbi:MAG: PAS domain-containing protein [Verrucomicrobia bacterium]|nr:PAS domain-containing protein [Verrucomicrobiota bacterium]
MKDLEHAFAASVARPKAIFWSVAGWALLALLAVLPIGVLSLYSFRVGSESIRTLVQINNLSVATLAAELMGRELERRTDLAVATAAMPELIDAVERHDEEAVRTRLRVPVSSYPGIDRALVASPEGVVWSDYPRAPESLGRSFVHRDWYRGVTNGWKPHVSEVFQRQAAPQPLVVAISAPIRRDGRVIGILSHQYRLDAIAGWLKDLRVGEHGYVFVIDHSLTVVAHPWLPLQEQKYREYSALPLVQAALAGRASRTNYLDPVSQRLMIANFVPVPIGNQHWALVAQQPLEDAAAPLRRLRLQLATGAGILALVAGGVVVLLGWTTERNRRLHRQLAEERNLLRSLIDTLPDLVYVKDTESRFLLANASVTRLMGGKDAHDLLGKTDFEFFRHDLAARYRADEVEVSRTGRPLLNREELVIDHDGTQRWFSSTKAPLRDREGRIIGLVGVGRDITQRRRAEEALRASEMQLQAMLDNTTAVVYLKDLEGRYLLINHRFEQLFHVKREEIVGKTDYDIFPRELADVFRANDRRVLEAAGPVQLEETAPHDDGPHTYLSVKFPLTDSSGQPHAVCGISTDITERKRAESEINRAKEAAEAANRAKSEFLANMSHELRTPLNSVIGFASILLRNKGGNLRHEDLLFLERIVVNGKHLLDLINQVLDLSKIEARRIDLDRAPVALERLVLDTLSQFEAQVRDRPIALKSELPSVLRPLLADERRLKQVLINLIGNAIKFTEKGAVTVRVQADAATHHPLRIEVADTGIGVRPDRLGLIFEAFRQGDTSTTRKYGGTGLGLTISKSLCDLMGYRLEVHSEPGKGSTFSVIFPAPLPEAGSSALEGGALAASTSPAPMLETEFPARKKLVLVIDDEADSRILLSRLVEECGWHVVVAETGETGLRLARELRPDLIALDLLMPQMDGWAVLRHLKTDPALARIPVVVASVVGDEARGTLCDTCAVLQKPVLREELLRVLRLFPKPKVLVVDDNSDHRRLMVSHLAGEAVEIAAADNGQDALLTLEKFAPDLIFLDLMMPHMDGLTFLSALRQDPRFQHVPVCVVTAKELTAAETRRLQSDAQAVLRKENAWGEDLPRLLKRLLGETPARITAESERRSRRANQEG